MKITMAHLRERSTSGGWINFAVFDAKSTNGNNDQLLSQLTRSAELAGLRVDQSALAFSYAGQIRFYGNKNLVSYLSKNGLPRWTHTIDA